MTFDLLWLLGAKKKSKKKSVCLVFVNMLGIIKGHLGSRDLLCP